MGSEGVNQEGSHRPGQLWPAEAKSANVAPALSFHMWPRVAGVAGTVTVASMSPRQPLQVWLGLPES